MLDRRECTNLNVSFAQSIHLQSAFTKYDDHISFLFLSIQCIVTLCIQISCHEPWLVCFVLCGTPSIVTFISSETKASIGYSNPFPLCCYDSWLLCSLTGNSFRNKDCAITWIPTACTVSLHSLFICGHRSRGFFTVCWFTFNLEYRKQNDCGILRRHNIHVSTPAFVWFWPDFATIQWEHRNPN